MVYNLTKVPAFGFESQNIKAVDAEKRIAESGFNYLVNVTKRIAKIKHKTNLNNSQAEAAFLNKLANKKKVDTYSKEDFLVEECEKFHKVENRKKIAGYVPVIGTFLGLNRLITMATKQRENFSKMNILRGVIETLSLGILLLPADLAVTSYRKRKWKKMQETV